MKIVGGEKEIIHAGQIEIRFPLESKDSNGQLAMFEFTVPAGAKVPMPHSHTHYDETIYGLEGVITFTVNGQPVDIAPRQSCFIPRGAVHGVAVGQVWRMATQSKSFKIRHFIAENFFEQLQSTPLRERCLAKFVSQPAGQRIFPLANFSDQPRLVGDVRSAGHANILIRPEGGRNVAGRAQT